METNENKQSNFDRVCKGLTVFFMAAIFCVLAAWFGVYLAHRDVDRTCPLSPTVMPKAVASCPMAGTVTSQPPAARAVPVTVRMTPPAPASAKVAPVAAKPADPPSAAARPAGRTVQRSPRMVLVPPQSVWPFCEDEDPFERMAQMQERMASWMGDDDWDLTPPSPAVDMREGKDGFDISCELPEWADPSTLKVDAQDDVLSLSVQSEDKGSIMKQSFRVPGSGISTNAIDAAVSNGVLRVHIHPGAVPAARR